MVGLSRAFGGLKVNFPFCLAPMVGLSHFFLRQAVREYLPEGAHTIWPTEMLNSRRLKTQQLGQTPETFRRFEESGLVPQILGNEEGDISESVQRLVQWGAVGIDINMGCPVQKALKHNYGVSLMGDQKYASEVVQMTVRNSQVPVSVKLRSGFSRDSEFLKDFVQALEGSGAQWITLHPRLAGEGRRGEARWEEIAFVREQIKTPVIGNGDIQVFQDALQMLRETGCDAVMVGRAMTARPWIFWQLGEELGWPAPIGRKDQSAPRTAIEEGREYGVFILKIITELKHAPNQGLAMRQLKFLVKTGSVWLQFGHNFYALISKCNNLSEAEGVTKEFFRNCQWMSGRTNLRQ